MNHYKFKTQTIEERLIHTMLGTISILTIIYCVILLSLVFSVIERKQNMLAIKDLTSKASYLESNYANEISSINDSTLLAHNFTRVDSTMFAIRKDPIASFSVLYER